MVAPAAANAIKWAAPDVRDRWRRNLTEVELTLLGGISGKCSRENRNAAQGQLQLDIYGELLDAVYLYNKPENR
jgi:hypothetical protein